jgi:hypothetical protein
MSLDWRDRAACSALPLSLFFEDVYPSNDDGTDGALIPEALERARGICASCPVRLACHEDAMTHEAGAAANRRHGVSGGLTPAQRYSLWRRDSWRCEQCGELYDPLGIVAGEAVCICGWNEEPPIPDAGDQWFPRHDELLRLLIAWLLEETVPGDRVPPPYKMLEILGYRRKDDMPLIYARLLDDGLLMRGDGRGVYFRRAGRGALASWQPPARRRRSAPNLLAS